MVILTVLMLQFFERESVQRCLYMLEQAAFTSRRNPGTYNKDPFGMILTPRNPSKPQFWSTISALDSQSRKLSLSSDLDEVQGPTLQRSPMKISVPPKKEMDNEYENEVHNVFRPSPQQPSKPVNHGLEENPFYEDGDASKSDYQSDHKLSRRSKSLKKNRLN